MHLMLSKKPSGTYATAANSVRGEDGKSVKVDKIYLGKVIDLEKGIFESKERGLFTFDVETGNFGDANLAEVPKKESRGKRTATLDFGNAYVFDRYLKDSGIGACIDACGCQNPDTFRALLAYYVFTDEPNSWASTWYDGNYAKLLYPSADMDDRRISEFLRRLGSPDVRMEFFKSYIPLICGKDPHSFIIDSLGIPNSIHMPVTAISNHNGELSLEVRMILVCRRTDRMPIYFRYVAGNVIDSSTLIRTADELECMGLNIDYILMDAGYCTLQNMVALLEHHIGFVTRLKPNFTAFREMVRDNLGKLGPGTRVKHKDRFLRVYSEERVLQEGTGKVWFHLIRDEDAQYTEDKRIYEKWQEGRITEAERDEAYETSGLFILVSSYWLSSEDVIPTYFERGGIEQLIDTGRNSCRLSEAAVHSEEAMNGKWLIQFTALAVVRGMQNTITVAKQRMMASKRKNKDDIPGRNMCVDQALSALRNQKCDVFEKKILPREKSKDVNTAYRLFGYESPRYLDR